MKYLKTYKLFESNMNIGLDSKYGIHDWVEDLKSFEWGKKPLKDLEKWTNHFIGDGYYQKIKDKVDRMFVALNKVDFDYVEDRLLMDVFDNLPSGKDKHVYSAIAYGNISNYDKDINYKYNGLVTAPKRDDNDKLRIMVHIIKEICFPTFYIGSYPNMMLRQSDESYYVTDPKWQCANFNIDDFQEIGIKPGTEFDSGDHKGRKTLITDYDIKQKKDYSVDKIIEMYVPSIVIDIGRHGEYMQGKMNLEELEGYFDESLPSILPTLDYSDVIFDHSRGTRQYSNTEIYDYTVKILLNF